MSDPGLVSVVVPAYNAAPYLGACLESILAQSYPALEVLVLDDASTDDTAQVAARFGDRIRYHRQAANRGIYRNADDGIALARGEYVAVYHADDVYLPDIVAQEVAWLESHPEAAAVFCLDIFVDGRNREYGRLELPRELRGERPLSFATVLDALLRYKNSFLVCPTAMVRADVYREIGPYRQDLFANGADLDMWLRIVRRAPIGVLDRHLMRYRHFAATSSSRYHYLRRTPARYFAILDHHLAAGARAVADPQALRDFEAHRAEDAILIAVAHYIASDRRAAAATLAGVRAATLLRSARIRRVRMLALLFALRALARLPRIPPLAALFHRRWHARREAPG